jgi:hypothetical protein
MTENDLTDIFGETIACYTTEDGIADGYFVRLDTHPIVGDLVAFVGIRCAVVLTAAVYGDLVKDDREEAGTLLLDLRRGLIRNADDDRAWFYCEGKRLKAVLGYLGDEPCITVCYPEED